MSTQEVNDELQKAIDYCHINEDGNVEIPSYQLDRKVYVALKKKLGSVGLKWKSGKTKAFVGPNAEEALLEIKSEGARGEDLKKKYQYFATPIEVIEKMKEKIWDRIFSPMDRVLEPSAGQGAIIKEFEENFGTIDYCEIWEINRKHIDKIASAVFRKSDFLELEEKYKYDLIVANPPFSRNQDITHIKKMYSHLTKGGRLVTIASTHWTFANEKKCIEFRAWLDEVGAEWEELDAGLFKSSGTEIATTIIRIDKS